MQKIKKNCKIFSYLAGGKGTKNAIEKKEGNPFIFIRQIHKIPFKKLSKKSA